MLSIYRYVFCIVSVSRYIAIIFSSKLYIFISPCSCYCSEGTFLTGCQNRIRVYCIKTYTRSLLNVNLIVKQTINVDRKVIRIVISYSWLLKYCVMLCCGWNQHTFLLIHCNIIQEDLTQNWSKLWIQMFNVLRLI